MREQVRILDDGRAVVQFAPRAAVDPGIVGEVRKLFNHLTLLHVPGAEREVRAASDALYGLLSKLVSA